MTAFSILLLLGAAMIAISNMFMRLGTAPGIGSGGF